MRLFPPTGLEYVATSAKGLTEKLTLLDLRYEKELSDTDKLLSFIGREIDIICVSIGWDRQFKEICDLLNRMPDDIPLVVGGYNSSNTSHIVKLCREKMPTYFIQNADEICSQSAIRHFFQSTRNLSSLPRYCLAKSPCTASRCS